MINLTLPIYYKDKKGTHLLGMNHYLNMHYHPRNAIKKDYYERVDKQVKAKIKGKYKAHYKLWYKNVQCDAPNIIAVIDKLVMDGLQASGAVEEDNIKYYIGATWEIAGRDLTEPRVEVAIIPVL